MGNTSLESNGATKKLFGEELVNFTDEEFDASKEHYKIFEEVFFKNNMENMNANATHLNPCSSKQDLSIPDTLVSFVEGSDSCATCGVSCHDTLIILEKFSSLNLIDQERKALVILGVHSKTSEGVSDLAVKLKGDLNATELIVDAVGLNNNDEVPQKEEAKVVMEVKSVTSPVSEESVATKETLNATVCANQNSEAPICLETSNTAAKIKKPQKREVHCRLESCAHRVLKDAGWKIKPRQRVERIRMAYSFKNAKEGLNCKTLILAWKSCGEKLLASASDSEKDEIGREWCEVDSFLKDLNDTLDYSEKEACQVESSVSLLKRWQLLDPFMAVIWIDKKLSVLRAGKGLKAVNSTTFMTDKVAIKAEKKVKDKRKKSYKLSSKHTAAQTNSSCVDENKILIAHDNFGEINMDSEIQSPVDQASCAHEGNIVSSTDSNLVCNSVYKEFSSIQQESSSIAEEMVPEATKSKVKRTAATLSDGSAKKARKKSKKISEIEATKATGTDDSAHCMNDKAANLISEPKSECLQNLRIEESNSPANIKVYKKSRKSETSAKKLSKKKNKDENGVTLSKERIEHDNSECETKRLSPNESSSMSSKKQKVAHDQLIDHKVAVSTDSESDLKESEDEETCDEGLMITSDITRDKSEVTKKTKQKKIYRCRINDNDLLTSVILKCKKFGSDMKRFSLKAKSSRAKESRKPKNQNESHKSLPRVYNKRGGIHNMGARTVLAWLIEMGAVSLKDVLQVRNLKNNEVLKDGRVTREGILCKCCAQFLSVSEFKTHAGLKQQKSSLNLFLQSGKAYSQCQLLAWSAEYKKRNIFLRKNGADETDEGDDTCGICGDGGDLVLCDNCPSTYHETCLSTQVPPEGDWYCSNCICVMCKDSVGEKETSGSLGVLECSQCQHKYHGACIVERVAWNGKIGSNAWFCGESCHEVYVGMRSRVGMANHIDDEYSWTILRCNHDDKRICSARKVALMAECNSKLAIALTLMEECFLPMVDPKTGINMIPHALYNFGSPFARLNYQGFYAVVLEKGDVLISVASIRLHGIEVAEMPLIVTCYKYRRQGMCRRLLNAIEKMLRSFKVKMLLISAIPSVVETWISGFGFQPVDDEEKKQLTNFNLMPFPGTTLLKKNLLDASALESVESTDYSSEVQESQIHDELMESGNIVARLQSTENTEITKNSTIQRENDFLQTEALTCIAEYELLGNKESCSSLRISNVNEMDHVLLTSQNSNTVAKDAAAHSMNSKSNVYSEDRDAKNILVVDFHDKPVENLSSDQAEKDKTNDVAYVSTSIMGEN